MRKRYLVQLTAEERRRCLETVRSGRAPARTITHARILLQADCGPQGPAWTDQAIAEACQVSRVTVANVRQRMARQGLEAALAHYRSSGQPRRRRLDGHQEAHLIALACSEPPAGRARWSLRLLAQRMVELAYVPTVSYGTVRRTLKKTNCSPGAAAAGASHPAKTRAS
jgi:transposase